MNPLLERPHKRLIAWQKAMDLVPQVYRATANFPPEERYALTNQMRRAAVSIPSNIAEGAARRSKAEKRQFYLIARASLSELETQMDISERIGYVSMSDIEQLASYANEVGRLLNGLINAAEN
jgi:four helix bundle protein